MSTAPALLYLGQQIIGLKRQSVTLIVFRRLSGFLGNCWFMSALAVVAERPELLKRLFVTQDYCHQGAYQIRMNLDGDWRVVLIDDWFPCCRGGRGLQMVFSVGRRNQLWVPLVEKAMAKAFGGYAALVSGKSIEGLSILTGALCESINLESML